MEPQRLEFLQKVLKSAELVADHIDLGNATRSIVVRGGDQELSCFWDDLRGLVLLVRLGPEVEEQQ